MVDANVSAEVQGTLRIFENMVSGTNQMLSAAIYATADRIQDTDSRDILKAFKKHVEQGGRLLTIPVSDENVQDFEKYLKNSEIMAYKVEIIREPGVKQYLFRDKDATQMDELILAMRNDGKEILKSTSRDYKSLSEYGEGNLHVATFKDDTQAQRMQLILDSHQIPYAKTQFLNGTEVAVASKDFELMFDLPEFKAFASVMKPVNRKTTYQETRGIIAEQKAKERLNADARQNTHEKSSERWKGRK